MRENPGKVFCRRFSRYEQEGSTSAHRKPRATWVETTRTTWVENHRGRFSFPRATFCPLGATPVDRLFFEIGVFPTPRTRADGGTCTGSIRYFCFCVLLACVLHILRPPGSSTQYKFVRIRSCAWVPSYRVRVDHVCSKRNRRPKNLKKHS